MALRLPARAFSLWVDSGASTLGTVFSQETASTEPNPIHSKRKNALAAVEAEEAQEEAGEDDLEAKHEGSGGGEGEAQEAVGAHVAEAGGVPEIYGVDEDRGSTKEEEAAEEEADLQGDGLEESFELGIGREEAFLGAEDLGGDGKDGDMGSDENQAEGVGEGVDIEGVGSAAEMQGARSEQERGG